jgi:hypothetical protein
VISPLHSDARTTDATVAGLAEEFAAIYRASLFGVGEAECAIRIGPELRVLDAGHARVEGADRRVEAGAQ